MIRWGKSRFLIRLLAGLVLLVGPISAQQLSKRLILKDGTYQLATKWEVQGEHVRYFSAERSEWEEVPNGMVDWAATDRYQKERAAGVPLPEAVEFDKKLAAERAAEEAKRPEVAPGLRLPADGGVLLLDTFENQPQLVPLEEKVVRVNQKGKGDVACNEFDQGCAGKGNQVITVKNNVEIAGPHADVQAHATVPVLYLKLESVKLGQMTDATSLKEVSDRFQIVRAQAKKDRRIVGAIKVSINGIAKQEEQKSIPAQIEPVGEGWLKITPTIPLTSGEYGLVELMNGKGGMNLSVQAVYLPDNIWDFGVNPVAPANPLALKPEVPGAAPLADQPPSVQNRPESPKKD
jgi:hypothetical protein